MTPLLVMLALTILPATTLDEVGPPVDYVRPVKGGKYVFVMLRAASWRKHAYSYEVFTDSSSDRSSPKDGLLFKKYPSSGLYRNDGSNKPIWTVDWYGIDVRACSDGVHLVRFGPWPDAGDEGKTLALAFYRSGKLFKHYTVRDLVANPKQLPRSVSHYRWMKSNTFDDAGKRLKVQVFQGYDYLKTLPMSFDITTGSISPKDRDILKISIFL